MKKDIHIPPVEGVYVAAMKEWNDDFMQNTWYAYLINDSKDVLETAIIVSSAKGELNGEEKKTSMLRHAFVKVEPDTAVRIEMIEDSVLQLNNSFMVTFFIGNTLYDKNYVFRANTINDDNIKLLPVINKEGILLR